MTVETAQNSPAVRFQGFGEGAELLGAMQMNFFVPALDREYAISINVPAIDRAMQQVGVEDSESREVVARELARLLLLQKLRDRRLEPFNFYGLRLFDEHPGIIDDLKAAVAEA